LHGAIVTPRCPEWSGHRAQPTSFPAAEPPFRCPCTLLFGRVKEVPDEVVTLVDDPCPDAAIRSGRDHDPRYTAFGAAAH
jgi:hypothetical protein